MLPRLRTIILLAASAAVLFAGGAISAIRGGWASGTVIIEVENVSIAPISLIEVEVTTCGITRTIQQRVAVSDSANVGRKSVKFEVFVCGEASHRTRVTTASGKILESAGSSYMERGARVKDSVHDDRISWRPISREPYHQARSAA